MDKRTFPKKPRTDVRTTISLSKKVMDWAGEMMEEEGYNNFSAYVADLIRRRRESASDMANQPTAKEGQTDTAAYLMNESKRRKAG